MSVNFYKLMRRLQWGTHLGLAGGKRVKNKLTDILLMLGPNDGRLTILGHHQLA